MSSRATLHVPSPSPESSLTLGRAWKEAPWTADGVSVVTQGRVWLDARGSTSSTLTLRARGEGEVGQLLLQSLRANLYVFARNTARLSTEKSLLIAGAQGVKMITGHGAPYMIGMFGVVADSTLARVTPDDEDASSGHAKNYADRLDTVAEHWGMLSAAAAGVTVLHEALLTLGGVEASTKANTAALVAGYASAATAASETVGLGKAGVDEVPGLQMHAYHPINLATTGFATVASGAGLSMLGGANATVFGWLEAGVFGGLGASMKALWSFDVSGNRVDLAAGGDARFAAQLARLRMYGIDLQIGQPVPTWPSQAPTQEVSVEALTVDAEVQLGRIEVFSSGAVLLDGLEVKLGSDLARVVLKAPGSEVVVDPMGVTVTVAATTKMQFNDTSFGMDNGTMSVVGSDQGVRVASADGASSIEVSEQAVTLASPLIAFT